ncbi:hypothetical protein D3C71_1945420 [compost metagenome]
MLAQIVQVAFLFLYGAFELVNFLAAGGGTGATVALEFFDLTGLLAEGALLAFQFGGIGLHGFLQVFQIIDADTGSDERVLTE